MHIIQVLNMMLVALVFVASTEGKKSRKIVEFGIQALKAVWHRGAVDADGKTGDGAGIHIEIPTDFFKERIENYGRRT